MAATTLVLLAALAVVLLAGRSDGARSTGFEGSLRPPAIPPARFALRDQDGHVVRLADLRGRPSIITFMYSTCRDTCPVTAQQIRMALDDLHTPVPAVAISVDPANDTPLNARRFLAQQSMTGRMHFLLGTRAQLAPLWKAYGIQPQSKRFEHSAYVVLLDARGRQRVGWPVHDLTPEGLVHDLSLLGAR